MDLEHCVLVWSPQFKKGTKKHAKKRNEDDERFVAKYAKYEECLKKLN